MIETRDEAVSFNSVDGGTVVKRSSGSSYEQIFEQAPYGILTVDREGRAVACNDAACRLIGAPRHELLGTAVLQWVPPGERQALEHMLLRALQGAVVDGRTIVERRDGAMRRISLRAVPLVEGGTVIAINVFASESADEPEPQAHLVAEAQRLLETLPGQFVVVLDAGARIQYARGVAGTHWYMEEECVGRDFAFLLEGSEDNRSALEAMRRETAAGKRWTGVQRHVRSDGSRFPVDVVAAPYCDLNRGEITGISLVGRDATGRVEAASRSKRAEQFAGIGELVVSILRELHAPLVSVHVSAQHLLAQASGDTRHTLEEVIREAARARTLVETLLPFASEVRPERVPSDIGRIIAEVMDEQRPVLQAAHIRISVLVAPDLPGVSSDPSHVGQLLRTLLSNARDAVEMRANGQIRIEATRSAEGVLVRVQDNGPGIRAGDADRIFEPFFTTKPGRLGLGLSIARLLASAHGGRLWAERTSDGWTVFAVELPVEPPAPPTAFQAVPLTPSRGYSVLVIDDDEAIRGVIRRVLSRIGYRVSEAWSGRSALSQLASGDPPDFILTDLRMSDGTGYWFLNQLAKDYPHLLRRTVIVTGEGSTDAVERIARETGCRVVRKPFEFHELIAALDEVAAKG